MKQLSAYTVLAQFYDKLIDDYCDYEKWSQYLSTILFKVGAQKGVELACGTGKMTALLRKRGFDVIGIDNSVEMLNIARRNSNGIFVLSDMREFELAKKVDFVCCVNDGINYIESEQLSELFARVFDAIGNKGVFVFDISTEHKLCNVIADNVFYYDNDDCTCLWSNKLHKDKVVMELTLFQQNADGLYSRRDERHCQYIHSADMIQRCLLSVGFIKVDVTDCYSTALPKDKTQRLTFVAYKGM